MHQLSENMLLYHNTSSLESSEIIVGKVGDTLSNFTLEIIDQKS